MFFFVQKPVLKQKYPAIFKYEERSALCVTYDEVLTPFVIPNYVFIFYAK